MMNKWDEALIDLAIKHLVNDLKPGYNVSWEFTQKTRACGEKDGWVEHEIVPGSERVVLTIAQAAPEQTGIKYEGISIDR